MYPSNTTLFIH